MKFVPAPEDAEVVDSFDDIEVDEHDWAADGDDSLVPAVPGLLGRIADKLSS